MKMPEVNLDLIAATSVSMQRNKKFWDEEAEKILLENPLIYRLLNFTDRNSTKSFFKKHYYVLWKELRI